jgi:hypothetical protein
MRGRVEKCESTTAECRRSCVTHSEFDTLNRDAVTRTELETSLKTLSASLQPSSVPVPLSIPSVSPIEFSALRDEVG